MAVLSRVKMNEARHKQGQYAEQNRISEEKRKQERENAKPISEEEHKARINKLKEIGLIK
jgi:hypothetical protein